MKTLRRNLLWNVSDKILFRLPKIAGVEATLTAPLSRSLLFAEDLYDYFLGGITLNMLGEVEDG